MVCKFGHDGTRASDYGQLALVRARTCTHTLAVRVKRDTKLAFVDDDDRVVRAMLVMVVAVLENVELNIIILRLARTRGEELDLGVLIAGWTSGAVMIRDKLDVDVCLLGRCAVVGADD